MACKKNSKFTAINIGPQGEFGGFSLPWNFDTGTTATPGSRDLRFNNATLSSVSSIFVSETTQDNDSVQDFFTAIDNSGVYGLVKVFKESDSKVFWMGEVTATADNGTDWTLTVTHRASSGTFVNDDAVVLTFTPKGDTGIAGAEASIIIDDADAVGNPSGTSIETIQSHDFSADTSVLETNGDEIIIEVLGEITQAGLVGSLIELNIEDTGSSKRLFSWGGVPTTGLTYSFKLECRVKRMSNTSVRVENEFLLWYANNAFPLVSPINHAYINKGTVTGLDIDSGARTIFLRIDVATAVGEVDIKNFTIKELNI